MFNATRESRNYIYNFIMHENFNISRFIGRITLSNSYHTSHNISMQILKFSLKAHLGIFYNSSHEACRPFILNEHQHEEHIKKLIFSFKCYLINNMHIIRRRGNTKSHMNPRHETSYKELSLKLQFE